MKVLSKHCLRCHPSWDLAKTVQVIAGCFLDDSTLGLRPCSARCFWHLVTENPILSSKTTSWSIILTWFSTSIPTNHFSFNPYQNPSKPYGCRWFPRLQRCWRCSSANGKARRLRTFPTPPFDEKTTHHRREDIHPPPTGGSKGPRGYLICCSFIFWVGSMKGPGFFFLDDLCGWISRSGRCK